MSQREQLRAMLNARLASTGDGITALFEEKIREYEEEVNFLNQESHLRQKIMEKHIQDGMALVLCEDEVGAENAATSAQNKQDQNKQEDPPQN